MKPKTQIKIGMWTAIILLIGALGNTFSVLFTFRNNISDPMFWSNIIWPIVFSNVLVILLLSSFAFTVGRRLFKTSLFLLIVYILGVIRVFFTAEDYGVIWVIFEFAPIFLLSQAVIGVYKERHTLKAEQKQ